jgi:hypothetical protein
MTGVREHLTDLKDTEVKMEIALGDDSLVRIITLEGRRRPLPVSGHLLKPHHGAKI